MDDTAKEGASGSAEASGRFLLRIDPGLHAFLREAARHSGLSLNDYCSRKLAAPGCEITGAAGDVVMRSASLLGQGLVAVVAFGSWTRAQQRASSDVDVLIVVEGGVSITRDLYRLWDAEPIAWSSKPVEPHFVHLPEEGSRVSGLWAEAALDGVVLMDRNFTVAKRLVEIRHRIASGEISRRFTHGQPYWVGMA
jgi:predicted nucleotidyltransferase